MMDWKEKAIKTLKDSLFPVPAELNELDWKSGLSSKTDRLAQHISAFANYKGGGMLVYGVNNDGTCFNMSKEDIDLTIEKLGNIASTCVGATSLMPITARQDRQLRCRRIR